ncbi:hypothetical protein AtEden1_Chr3g0195571 [Arabidopsis thaliana]
MVIRKRRMVIKRKMVIKRRIVSRKRRITKKMVSRKRRMVVLRNLWKQNSQRGPLGVPRFEFGLFCLDLNLGMLF